MARDVAELIVQEFRKWAVMSPIDILGEFRDQYGAQVCEFYYAYHQGDAQLPLLVAHVDTVFSDQPSDDEILYDPETKEIHRLEPKNDGLGADDRLGVALVSLLLREFPNVGFLLTNYEEQGQIGAKVAVQNLAYELQHYPYLLQLDRQRSKHFAHYGHITKNFVNFLADQLPEWCLLKGLRTDITVICPEINRCGVNIAIGYYAPHQPDEFIRVDDAVLAYQAVRKLLQHPVDEPFKLREE